MLSRIGFIGAALGHPRTLGLAFRNLGIAELSGLWARQEESAAADRICDELTMPRCDTPEALIDASDLVVITTQTDEHKTYALQAIEQGRPVFVDKPFATSAADAAEMIEAAKRQGVGVMSCSLRRYAPAFQQLAEACRGGAVGWPISAEQMLHVMQTLEAARLSADERRPVAISEVAVAV